MGVITLHTRNLSLCFIGVERRIDRERLRLRERERERERERDEGAITLHCRGLSSVSVERKEGERPRETEIDMRKQKTTQ